MADLREEIAQSEDMPLLYLTSFSNDDLFS